MKQTFITVLLIGLAIALFNFLAKDEQMSVTSQMAEKCTSDIINYNLDVCD